MHADHAAAEDLAAAMGFGEIVEEQPCKRLIIEAVFTEACASSMSNFLLPFHKTS